MARADRRCRVRTTCSVEGCATPHWAKSYCRLHYRRWAANGTVELRTFEQRFWSFVDKQGADECWPWTGATARGYGHGHRDRKHFYAHRVSWEMANGQTLDSSTVVRHTCDNPPCVNPAHLVIGTQGDNIADMTARGRAFWQQPGYGRATHCRQGHDLDVTGRPLPNGGRSCSTCRREAARRWRAERRVAEGRPAVVTPWRIPPETVLHIRADYDSGVRVKEIAAKFGLPTSTVSRIARRVWRADVVGEAS